MYATICPILVVMYMDISTSGKYRRVLLRESYRQDGKVKKRTVANISKCSDESIGILQFALRNADKLPGIVSNHDEMGISHGKSVGAVFVAAEIARRTGITKALGCGRQPELALWQIIARLIDQGSRLSAVRLHQTHALSETVGLEKGFCEDDLYKNLAWLSDNQAEIEDRLFKARHDDQQVDLFLYDVTSSYLEGTHNELNSHKFLLPFLV